MEKAADRAEQNRTDDDPIKRDGNKNQLGLRSGEERRTSSCSSTSQVHTMTWFLGSILVMNSLLNGL